MTPLRTWTLCLLIVVTLILYPTTCLSEEPQTPIIELMTLAKPEQKNLANYIRDCETRKISQGRPCTQYDHNRLDYGDMFLVGATGFILGFLLGVTQ